MCGKNALAVFTCCALQLLGALSASAQTIQTVAGGQLFVNSSALQVGLNNPNAVAYAPNGTVYLSDGNKVEQFNPSTGLISTVAGTGFGGYSGDGGPATGAELNDPSGVAVDGAGNLYIADLSNQRIRKVSAATGIITTVAGNGTLGYSGDDGPATSAELNDPIGVAVDGAGNLYIADSNNARIRIVSAAGVISTVAGDGTQGDSGNGGAATSAKLNRPSGVAVDGAGNLYIADTNNSVIRKVTAGTGVISTVAGDGTQGDSGDGGLATSAELKNPVGVAVDGAGNLYISDFIDNRIRMVSVTGVINTVAGSAAQGDSGDGGPATSAKLDLPYGVAVDGAGDLYIADTDNYRIRMVNAAGVISTVAGNGDRGGADSGDGGPATTSAALDDPSGVVVDGAGNLYIADTIDHRIRMVSAATGIISTVAGNGTFGYSGDGGPATSAELSFPYGVAVDGTGNLYIADEYNSVIREVSAGTGVISTVVGNGMFGYSGDGGPATSAELSSPYGVAVDGAGNLYIADAGNAVIRKVTAESGIISTVAGNGTEGYSGDGGPPTSAELNDPVGVAVDGAGNLYIADEYNSVIRKVSIGTGAISTVAGNGTFGYAGDGGPATSAELSFPYGVAVDGAGNLYIADAGNAVIRKVTAESGIISTVAGNGMFGYSGDGGPATSAELADPSGVAVSFGGGLYIADTTNDVVREVTGVAVPRSPPVVTPVVTGTLGNNGWYTSNVQVSWTVSGGPSPISSQTGCGAVTISTDTPGQTLTCSATSAGGGTTTQSVTIKRDAAPPTISVTAPTNGATYTIGTTIAAAYSCADALSGPASCVGTVANGAPVSTAGTGSHTFIVSATDEAGNVAQTMIGYSVGLASQSITFGALASEPAGTMLALQASASSALPVTFTSSPSSVCTVAGSTATLLYTGTCTITASQLGNATYAAATPVSQSFTVTPKLTSDTVTLGLAGGNQTYPAWTNFAIGPSYKGTPVPTGTVTLYDNGSAVINLTLGSNGVAYYTANPLNAGVNVMTASYSGDTHYAPGVSAPVTLNVAPAPVHLTSSCWGGSPYKVAYQCTVNVSASTATPPTGGITYSLDGAAGTVVALAGGNASFTIPTLPASGAHKLTIAYAGQGNYAAATTLTESFTTAPGQTELLISSSSYSLLAGSPLTLTVTASTPQSGVPPGSVTLYDNGTALGTAPIGINGVATYPVAHIPKGTNTYTAKYAATANYAAANSGSASVTAH